MEDRICPKCGQKHLREHTKLVTKENGAQDIHYEWECGWCGYTYGDYASIAEARKEYEQNGGGQK